MPPGAIRPWAAILCGGAGKRLRKVLRGRPKPMAPVAGVPFLDFLIAHLLKYGIRDIVLCTGYKSGVIEKHYRRGIPGARIAISREEKPLGTAGALKHAAARIKSDPFFVLNGDSICAADLRRLLRFHLKKKALASVVLTKAAGRSDVGSVLTDRAGLVVKFSEKSGRCAYVNAGIYLLDKKVLAFIPKRRAFSLEYELFPKLKNCYGFKSRADLLDIGVPERYKTAQQVLNLKTPPGHPADLPLKQLAKYGQTKRGSHEISIRHHNDNAQDKKTDQQDP